jgi:hypothetical protein
MKRKIKRSQVSRMLKSRERPRVALLMPVSGTARASDADVDADAAGLAVDVTGVVVDSADMPVGWRGEEVDEPAVAESVVLDTIMLDAHL